MVFRTRPALLAGLMLLGAAAPALASGGSTAAAPTPSQAATPGQPGGQVTARPAQPGAAQAPARPAQAVAPTPAPSAPRTN